MINAPVCSATSVTAGLRSQPVASRGAIRFAADPGTRCRPPGLRAEVSASKTGPPSLGCHLLACPAVPAGGALIGPGSHGIPTILAELSLRNQRDGPMCPSYVACPLWTGARRLRSSSLTPNPSPGGRGGQEWHGGLTSSARWNCLRLRSSLSDFLPRLMGHFQGARGLREKPWGNQCPQDDVRTGSVELH